MGLGTSKPEPTYTTRPPPNYLRDLTMSSSRQRNFNVPTPLRYTYTLYVTRHGISCANVMKTQEYGLFSTHFRTQYTDPELTTIGRQAAIQYGYLLRQTGMDFKKMIIGSSELIRAQQTAYLMTQPEKFYIVPYVSEIAAADPQKVVDQENIAFSLTDQIKVLDANLCGQGSDIARVRNIEYFIPYLNKYATFPNIDNFKQWLYDNYEFLGRERKLRDPNMFLVTHSGFIKKLYKHIKGIKLSSDDVKNYSVHAINVEVRDKVYFTDIQEIDYGVNTPINFKSQCDIDTCRKPIGCSKKISDPKQRCYIRREEDAMIADPMEVVSRFGGKRRKSVRKTKRVVGKTRHRR